MQSPEKIPKPRVLCVDDEPRVLDGLKLTLRRRFDVIVETDPLQALTLLATASDIVAVVSDMRMPVMDGAAFLLRVGELRPNVARILLSGETGCSPAFSPLPADHTCCILSKPCTPEQLLATMLAAIDLQSGNKA